MLLLYINNFLLLYHPKLSKYESQIILIPSLTPSHMVDEMIGSDPAYYVVGFLSLAAWNSNFCYLIMYYLMLLLYINNF